MFFFCFFYLLNIAVFFSYYFTISRKKELKNGPKPDNLISGHFFGSPSSIKARHRALNSWNRVRFTSSLLRTNSEAPKLLIPAPGKVPASAPVFRLNEDGGRTANAVS